MKICPKCNSSFADETLTFCLTDGTLLVEENAAKDFEKKLQSDEIETVEIPASKKKKGNSAKKAESQLAEIVAFSAPTTKKSSKKKSAEVEVTAAVEKSNKILYAVVGVIAVIALVGGTYFIYGNKPFKAVGSYLGLTKTEFKDMPVGGAKTPTEAYKMLFAAVKSKDPEKIKLMMSENSMGFAGFVSGQQKKTVEEVLANGFTATTFNETMPQMRDERIKDNFGALEVLNNQKQWEDLPFVLEGGSWKLAIGDMFKGSYEKPGIGQSVREQEAANAVNNNMIEIKPNANVNNANVEMIIPKNSDAMNKNVPKINNPTLGNVNK